MTVKSYPNPANGTSNGGLKNGGLPYDTLPGKLSEALLPPDLTEGKPKEWPVTVLEWPL